MVVMVMAGSIWNRIYNDELLERINHIFKLMVDT